MLDDIDRAREHGELEGGFKAVADSLERIVAAQGLMKFGSQGDEFDPKFHEALMHAHSPDVTTTTCQNIVTRGLPDRRARRTPGEGDRAWTPSRRRRVSRHTELRGRQLDRPGRPSRRGGARMTSADWANKDFYKVLGVAKDASAADIKKAYRKLARDNHPDSHPGDKAAEDRFKAVAEAYDVVGDTEKRKQYDELRAGCGGFGPFAATGAAAPAAVRPQRPVRRRTGRRAAGGGGFGDLFGGMFGGGGPHPHRRRGRGAAPTSRPTRPSGSRRRSRASPCRCG